MNVSPELSEALGAQISEQIACDSDKFSAIVCISIGHIFLVYLARGSAASGKVLAKSVDITHLASFDKDALSDITDEFTIERFVKILRSAEPFRGLSIYTSADESPFVKAEE